jgi:hypothetical protein
MLGLFAKAMSATSGLIAMSILIATGLSFLNAGSWHWEWQGQILQAVFSDGYIEIDNRPQQLLEAVRWSREKRNTLDSLDHEIAYLSNHLSISYGPVIPSYFTAQGRYFDAERQIFPPVPGRSFRLPLMVPFALAAALPLWSLRIGWQRKKRIKLGLCRMCGYDLRGTPDGCPECGNGRATTTLRDLSDQEPEADSLKVDDRELENTILTQFSDRSHSSNAGIDEGMQIYGNNDCHVSDANQAWLELVRTWDEKRSG